MRRRTGGGFDDRSRDGSAAAARDDDSVGAGNLGASNDRSEISGIFDMVADHDEGRRSRGKRGVDQLADGNIFAGRQVGDNALVGSGR